ncbi:TadE/TadG family type IV pilus assembly protein [Croceicoccus bisphenolivorans]|uniref:TadE/TadG family type IV pilus assembly protein n=1 Tax=Croceicoccus bisphenolivorans TaxID=1783232 RepID=UPI00083283E0|nr:TadE/TadG family type IV pilus assembly protein [Croceicoccus bisphenolivorans]
MNTFLNRLKNDERGVSIIEVAFLLPVLIGMMISVLQVGLYLQAQNAVRGVAGEISRFMAVESQKRNSLTPSQMEDAALSIAVTPPYILQISQLTIDVSESATQDIDRVRKMDVNMNYTVPNILGFADWGVLEIDYTRQLFIPEDLVREDSTDTTDTGDGTGDGTTDGTDPGTGTDTGGGDLGA